MTVLSGSHGPLEKIQVLDIEEVVLYDAGVHDLPDQEFVKI